MADLTVTSLAELKSIAREEADYYVVDGGNLTITCNIDIPGLIVANGNLFCEKDITAAGIVMSNGNISIGGNLTAASLYTGLENGDGNATFSGLAVITDFAGIEGKLSAEQDCYIGSFYADAGIEVNGNLSVHGWVVCRAEMQVRGVLSCLDYLVCNNGNVLVGKNIMAGDITSASGRVVAGHKFDGDAA